MVEEENIDGPRGRSGRTGTLIGDELFLFGGVDVNGNPTNALDKYCFKEKKWVLLEPKGERPPPVNNFYFIYFYFFIF